MGGTTSRRRHEGGRQVATVGHGNGGTGGGASRLGRKAPAVGNTTSRRRHEGGRQVATVGHGNGGTGGGASRLGRRAPAVGNTTSRRRHEGGRQVAAVGHGNGGTGGRAHRLGRRAPAVGIATGRVVRGRPAKRRDARGRRRIARNARPAPQEVQFQETPPEAPVRLADVFRRLGAQVDIEEDEPEPNRLEERPGQPADRADPRPTAPSPEPPGGGDEEESVDQYMARLMQRVRSSGDRTESAATTPAEPAPSQRQAPPVADSVAALKPQPAPQPKPVELAPRAPPGEKNRSLGIAGSGERFRPRAIGQYARKLLIRSIGSKLLVAVVALVASGGLLSMWQLTDYRPITLFSAGVALLVAIYWGVQYALLTGRLIISKAGCIDFGSSSERSSASPPDAKKDDGATSP